MSRRASFSTQSQAWWFAWAILPSIKARGDPGKAEPPDREINSPLHLFTSQSRSWWLSQPILPLIKAIVTWGGQRGVTEACTPFLALQASNQGLVAQPGSPRPLNCLSSPVKILAWIAPLLTGPTSTQTVIWGPSQPCLRRVFYIAQSLKIPLSPAPTKHPLHP